MRIQFTIKHLLIVVLLICFCFALVEFDRLTSKPELSDSYVFKVQTDDSPFHLVGAVCFRDFYRWIASTESTLLGSSNFRSGTPMKKICTVAIDIRFGSAEQTTIPFFVPETEFESEKEPEFVYFQWRGYMRYGDYASLQDIIHEPETVVMAKDDWEKKWFMYRDLDRNGIAEEKRQIVDSHTSIVWRDTNSDGYFDEESLHNGNFDYPPGFESKIHVRCPKVLPEISTENQDSVK